jgi:hypothetical protein
MIFIDAHVHIYPCFDLDVFFDAASRNFATVAKRVQPGQKKYSRILLLVEGAGYEWFGATAAQVQQKQQIITPAGRWVISSSGEADTLFALPKYMGGEKIFLVAGRQIVSAEKIEVLGLFCRANITDGLSLPETLSLIEQNNGVAVIPWGAGKWSGRRGKILQDYLISEKREQVFLGDSGGRPRFWPTPKLFRLEQTDRAPLLSGSDPLPLRHDALRVGSYGFCIDVQDSDTVEPCRYTKKYLKEGGTSIMPFGRLQKNSSFILNQIQLRLQAKNKRSRLD